MITNHSWWEKIKTSFKKANDAEAKKSFGQKFFAGFESQYSLVKGVTHSALRDLEVGNPAMIALKSVDTLSHLQQFKDEKEKEGIALRETVKTECSSLERQGSWNYLKTKGNQALDWVTAKATNWIESSPQEKAEDIGSTALPIALFIAGQMEPFIPGKTVPYGFSNLKKFNQMANVFREASGDPEAMIGMRGSAATGFRWKDGTPFDSKSDFDFFIVSQKVHDEAVLNGAWSKGGALPAWQTKRVASLKLAEKQVTQEMKRDADIRIFSPRGFNRFQKYYHIKQSKN